jgi:hypothetical protein
MLESQRSTKFTRFNSIMKDYIICVESEVKSKELHGRLRGLFSDAIRMDISLVELLEIFSHMLVEGSNSTNRDNTSTHSVSEKASAEIGCNESKRENCTKT